MITSIYLDLAFRRLRLGAVARPLSAGIDTVAGAVHRQSSSLRGPGPGAVFRNVLVVAGTPR